MGGQVIRVKVAEWTGLNALGIVVPIE